MKKLLFLSLFSLELILAMFAFTKSVLAIENPLSVPNNKFGIHILFVDELKEAAKLVNSNGGDWGYVTIPIQAGDKDLIKWQKFMDEAETLHVIPILRLASEGDYFNTKVWRKPTDTDVLDFANFLNSLDWPVKNRYIIVFNEPNRGDEWGGSPNPSEYSQILSYAVSVFKSKSQDFFVLSAGFDNAAVNVPEISINEFDFMRQMNIAVPGIFYQVDGLASHSYPNPHFSQPPSKQDSMSIASFRYEKGLIVGLANKTLPIFITETGWSKEHISENLMADYYKTAFTSVWADENIVAVTPFLLKAWAGPFVSFSFITLGDLPNAEYKAIEKLPKIKGAPLLSPVVLGKKTIETSPSKVKDFSKTNPETQGLISLPWTVILLFKWLLKI